ncbi:MAG TPA: SynChlorMet cassette protein ScmD [Syntrophorhabdales bacterium]|nr:SynChlorMet cassette protein ScmD [Syntrophorhabdales bacterium]
MKNDEKPLANPYVVLREEFDDWAVLFNPDTGRGFGLSPIGVHVWKLMDGEHTTDDLFKEILASAHEVPEAAREHVEEFIDELAAQGLAGFGSTGPGLPPGEKRQESFSSPPSGHICELKTFKYAPPEVDKSERKKANSIWQLYVWNG